MNKEIVTDFSKEIKARLSSSLLPSIRVLEAGTEWHIWAKVNQKKKYDYEEEDNDNDDDEAEEEEEEGEDQYGGRWLYADTGSVEGLKAFIKHSTTRYIEGFGYLDEIKACVITQYSDFGDVKVDRLPSLEAVDAFASFFSKHGELGVALLRYLNSPQGEKLAEAKHLLENHYYGAFKSPMDFIRIQLADPAFPENEADCPAMVKNTFEQHYFTLTVEGAVHIFDKVPTTPSVV